MTSNPPILLTSKQVAELLGLQPRTLAQWRYLGDPQLPYVRIGQRRIMYRASDVEAYVDSKMQGGRPSE